MFVKRRHGNLPIVSCHLQQAPSVIATKVANDPPTLVDFVTKLSYPVTGARLRIWRHLKDTRTTDELAERLIGDTDLEPRRARELVSTFIMKLLVRKMVIARLVTE